MSEHSHANILTALTDPSPAVEAAPPMPTYRDNAAPAEAPAPPYLVAGACTFIPAVYQRGERICDAKLGKVNGIELDAEAGRIRLIVYPPAAPSRTDRLARFVVAHAFWFGWACAGIVAVVGDEVGPWGVVVVGLASGVLWSMAKDRAKAVLLASQSSR